MIKTSKTIKVVPPVAKAQWTLDKLLKGAGPDADPTEIDVPVEVTELDRMLGGLIYG